MNFFRRIKFRQRLFKIAPNRIIPFDSTSIVVFNEKNWDNTYQPSNFLQKTFLLTTDLSLNLNIKVKWIEWGYHSFRQISAVLLKVSAVENLEKICKNSIQEFPPIQTAHHILLIDEEIILSENHFASFLLRLQEDIDFNSKLKLKLKINLHEFLWLQEYSLELISTKEFFTSKKTS